MSSLPVENMVLKIVENETKILLQEFSGDLVQDNNLIINFVF
jgi:hypothetical protein